LTELGTNLSTLGGAICRSIALVLGLWAVACTEPDQPQSGPVTIRLGVPAAAALPQLGLSNTIGNLTGESLLGIGWDGRPYERLATEWEWLPARRGVRLKLHPNIKFHDGTPLNAALARDILRPALANLRTQSSVALGSITEIEAADDRTLVLRASRSESFLPADLANVTLNHPTTPHLGTGPFRRLTAPPAGNELENDVTLGAFSKYYRGRPQIDVIEIKRYLEQRTAWAALMRGSIDAVSDVTPSAVDFVEAQSTVKTFPFSRPYYIQLLFNLRHPALKRAAVRQALSQAVDRKALVDLALNGRGVPAEGPLWPKHWAYSTAPRTFTFNPEAAILRLEAAGYRIEKRSGAMPSRFRFTCLTLAKDPRYEKIATLLQKYFQEIDVDMEVVALSSTDLIARQGAGDYDAVLLERTSGRSLAWTYLAYHSSRASNSYSAADVVLDRLRSATDDDQTRAGVSDLQKVLYDDPPAIFLVWPIVARAVSTRFTAEVESGHDVLTNVWRWRPVSVKEP
jgi:peptide/nickel transport system substrate-binding protein